MLCLAAALAPAGCGGGGERQDKDEPEGNFPVEVVRASFPEEQKLAKPSTLKIVVRNTGQKAIPNINVTVKNFSRRESDPGLAERGRPIFVIDRIPIREDGPPRDEERLDPLERSSAYVDTYPLGRLNPQQEITFRWKVTAVRAGPFCVSWRVNAGLDGKAKAVGDRAPAEICRNNRKASGPPTDAPTGAFAGVISERAPDARVAEDGHTVITE